MSKKKDFEEQLLEANTALRRSRKMKKSRRDKSDSGSNKHTDSLLATDSSIDGTNDAVDVEEDLCVVEVPTSASEHNQSVSDSSFVEMSAAEKLKSQSNKSNAVPTSIGAATTRPNKKRRTRRGSGTSSEEERWLDAIESGKLEQVDDELKKIKDPKLMTARQRAMYERSIEKDPSPGGDNLMALPTGYKEKVMTAEALEKAQLKSQKRKQLADEKREKDKRKTMDRLLKKQETKSTKMAKNKMVKVIVPVISYNQSIEHGASLSYPTNFEFPMQAQVAQLPPSIVLCAICNDTRKRYNCSKTNVPLCSFKCYKSNQRRQEITR
ncbi:INO80 complex subunit B [Sitodiplosis mosellana]|uniref:INO80 complex subunit B n=1 Tax=Sitodiplosis mosellana TaxID=263140 RepID=UPI0024445F23|nr:INO80 complex subunit B [Sitodiplosis mosellana]